jgi:hypothetical protein
MDTLQIWGTSTPLLLPVGGSSLFQSSLFENDFAALLPEFLLISTRYISRYKPMKLSVLQLARDPFKHSYQELEYHSLWSACLFHTDIARYSLPICGC